MKEWLNMDEQKRRKNDDLRREIRREIAYQRNNAIIEIAADPVAAAEVALKVAGEVAAGATDFALDAAKVALEVSGTAADAALKAGEAALQAGETVADAAVTVAGKVVGGILDNS